LPTKRRRRIATEIETVHYVQSQTNWKGLDASGIVEVKEKKCRSGSLNDVGAPEIRIKS
jgi:hypothetical protein